MRNAPAPITPTIDVLTAAVSGSDLLAVWAHPDDESFLGAGAMIAAADGGGRVVNCTATLGELGTSDPATWPPERLGRRRRVELDHALAHLGGAEVEVLGVRDGSCEMLDDRIGARRVASVIEAERPEVIVTFGPDGVTGHPDHQAISRWTQQGAAMVDSSIPVLVVVTASVWPADLIDPMNDVGAFFPGYPDRRCTASDVPVVLDDNVLDRKLAALAAHESQVGPLQDRLGPVDYRRLFAHEAYRPANAAAEALLGGRPQPALVA